MKNLIINKRYLHRHEILRVLQEKMSEGNHPNAMLGDVEIPYQKLIEKSGLSEDDVLKQLDYLHVEDEISIEEREFMLYYIILRKGTVAYNDEKYLRQGRKNFLDNTYDILKILIAAGVLVGYLWTFMGFVLPVQSFLKKEIEKHNTTINQPTNDTSINKPK